MTDITYFVDNKLGGVSSLNYNLVANAPAGVSQTVIQPEQKEWKLARANIRYPADKQLSFFFSGQQHYYHTLKKLYKLLPAKQGALVLNYETEMAMLDHYAVPQTSYQLVHDDYNVNLAKKYGHIVDVFICHNKDIENKLRSALPTRQGQIFMLPHGVPIPAQKRLPETRAGKPLRLLFLGRMTARKGIFDLPVIAAILREKAVDTEWTCVGNGPELEAFKKKWHPADRVNFFSPATNEEVMQICSKQDVFVLPTKFEGSPVSLLETMSMGLVPVVSRLAGGIEEVVTAERGFAIETNNNLQFALAIEQLSKQPGLLNRMSAASADAIATCYNVADTAKRYHDLFARYADFYKPKQLKKIKVGARLDHPAIPGKLTSFLRKIAGSKKI